MNHFCLLGVNHIGRAPNSNARTSQQRQSRINHLLVSQKDAGKFTLSLRFRCASRVGRCDTVGLSGFVLAKPNTCRSSESIPRKWRGPLLTSVWAAESLRPSVTLIVPVRCRFVAVSCSFIR